jgi:hypothetical protein
MAVSKSQICSILQHSIFDYVKEVFRTIFTLDRALKFVEMLLEGFSYALSIMVVNLNIFNIIKFKFECFTFHNSDVYLSRFR